MSYHQDDGQKPVYHGHATSGCLMALVMLPITLMRRLWR